MSEKKRLFWILWAAGFAGILSFLALDLSAIIAVIPQPPGAGPTELPFSPTVLKIVSLIQPTLIVTVAILAGVLLAGRVGLRSPAAEALARREKFLSALRPQIVPGIVAGVVAGLAIVGLWAAAKPFLSAEFITRAEAFNHVLPPITRFLYGGFTEEILLRWGVMTTLVWLPWRFVKKARGTPKRIYFVTAIFLSALLFGALHLPVAYLLAGGLTVPVAVYVIAANSIFGIAAGFLYWRRGLESAIIAHIFAHVVIIAAIALAV